jgi:hypothetical protein
MTDIQPMSEGELEMLNVVQGHLSEVLDEYELPHVFAIVIMMNMATSIAVANSIPRDTLLASMSAVYTAVTAGEGLIQ